MARKLIKTFVGEGEHANRTVKVYKDSEWGEYVYRLYVDGKLYEPADGFTDDKDDAFASAYATVNMTHLRRTNPARRAYPQMPTWIVTFEHNNGKRQRYTSFPTMRAAKEFAQSSALWKVAVEKLDAGSPTGYRKYWQPEYAKRTNPAKRATVKRKPAIHGSNAQGRAPKKSLYQYTVDIKATGKTWRTLAYFSDANGAKRYAKILSETPGRIFRVYDHGT